MKHPAEPQTTRIKPTPYISTLDAGGPMLIEISDSYACNSQAHPGDHDDHDS